MTDKHRFEYVDAWKGFAIFTVVMGHVIAVFFESYKDIDNNFPLVLYWWKLIYSFHMPLMFFISGYLFLSSRFATQSLGRIWFHKIQPLVLPYIFMGIVMFLLRDDSHSYWYLRTLFIYISIQILYEYIRKHAHLNWKSDIIWLCITYIIAVKSRYLLRYDIIDTLIDINRFSNFYIYFVLGVLFRRHTIFEIIKKIKNNESLFLLLSAGYIIFTIGFGYGVNKHLRVLFVLAIIISTYYVFHNKYKDKPGNSGVLYNFMKYMGKHSLEIYTLHFFVLFKIPEIGDFIIKSCEKGITLNDPRYILTGLTIELLLGIILSIVVILTCALIFESLKAFPLIYKLFLGRDIQIKS